MSAATAPSPPPAPAESPNVFRAEEAWRYLKFPSRRSFDENRTRLRKEMKLSFGRRLGRERVFCREELEQMRRILFGLDAPTSKRRGDGVKG